MYDALGEVVVAARQAMDWLKEVSQVAAQDLLPVWWTSPAGLPVSVEKHRLIPWREAKSGTDPQPAVTAIRRAPR